MKYLNWRFGACLLLCSAMNFSAEAVNLTQDAINDYAGQPDSFFQALDGGDLTTLQAVTQANKGKKAKTATARAAKEGDGRSNGKVIGGQYDSLFVAGKVASVDFPEA